MEENKYAEDLNHIKEVMSRSSRSVSLTGLSPIAAGIVGTISAYMVNRQFFQAYGEISLGRLTFSAQEFKLLSQIAWPTLILGFGLGIIFALTEIRKRRQEISSQHIVQLFVNLIIPLITGGLVCLFLFMNGYLALVLSLTLVFYGLALIHADKYTLGDIRTLGLLEIALGLCALYFVNYGMIFWGVGFGLLHIVYGVIMLFKRTS